MWLHRALIFLRWPILLAWAAITAGAYLYLPPLPSNNALTLNSVVPASSPGVHVQVDAVKEFGVPLLSRTAVVLRNPSGFTDQEQQRLVDIAKHTYKGKLSGFPEIAAAVPVVNARQVVPSAKETGTTAVVYLFFYPNNGHDDVTVAEQYANTVLQRPPGGTLQVVGPIAAEQEQGRLIGQALPWVELGTIAIVIVIVAVRFRSVLAPILTVLSAGISYVVTTHLLGWLGRREGFQVPGALEPLIVVLLIGVVTDYSVFFMAGFQERMSRGGVPKKLMVTTSRYVSPIVFTAGLAVAAGTASLLVARLQLFRRLGPGMAITVLVTMLVAVTFVPAALAVLGRASLWPSPESRRVEAGAHAAGVGTGRGGLRESVLRAVVHRPVAAVALLLGIGLIGVGTASLAHFRMGTNVVLDLPGDTAPARALQAASAGFAPGIVAPTELVVSAPGIGGKTAALADLQNRLAAEPGVAGLVGPGTLQLPNNLGVFVSPSGNAARFLIVLKDAPYSAEAIDDVGRLQGALPTLLDRSSLRGATAGWTGDTVLSQEIVDLTRGDLLRVGGVAIGVLLVILVFFLRALIAPLFLLLASAAVVAFSLGASLWLFTGLTAVNGPTFFMPLAVEVLLLSFGSDYNIFVVGRIRDRSDQLPWRTAIVVGGAEASRAIGSAGLALAGSFAMLAIVPLNAFRQFAFAMVVGILVDTFVVRSYLVPAALALMGRFSGWPGHRLGHGAEEQAAAPPPAAPVAAS